MLWLPTRHPAAPAASTWREPQPWHRSARRLQVERDGWAARYTTDPRTSLTAAPSAGAPPAASTPSPSPPVQPAGARCQLQPGGMPYVLTAPVGVLTDGTWQSTRRECVRSICLIRAVPGLATRSPSAWPQVFAEHELLVADPAGDADGRGRRGDRDLAHLHQLRRGVLHGLDQGKTPRSAHTRMRAQSARTCVHADVRRPIRSARSVSGGGRLRRRCTPCTRPRPS